MEASSISSPRNISIREIVSRFSVAAFAVALLASEFLASFLSISLHEMFPKSGYLILSLLTVCAIILQFSVLAVPQSVNSRNEIAELCLYDVMLQGLFVIIHLNSSGTTWYVFDLGTVYITGNALIQMLKFFRLVHGRQWPTFGLLGLFCKYGAQEVSRRNALLYGLMLSATLFGAIHLASVHWTFKYFIAGVFIAWILVKVALDAIMKQARASITTVEAKESEARALLVAEQAKAAESQALLVAEQAKAAESQALLVAEQARAAESQARLVAEQAKAAEMQALLAAERATAAEMRALLAAERAQSEKMKAELAAKEAQKDAVPYYSELTPRMRRSVSGLAAVLFEGVLEERMLEQLQKIAEFPGVANDGTFELPG